MARGFFLSLYHSFSWKKKNVKRKGKRNEFPLHLNIFKPKAGLFNWVFSLHCQAITSREHNISITHMKIVAMKVNYNVSGRTSFIIFTASKALRRVFL